MPQESKKKILFICETVTLAHIVRTLTLASALPPEKFEVTIAAGEIPKPLREKAAQHLRLLPLPSAVKSSVFLEALAKGSLPYTQKVLKAQIEEDVRLIKSLEPDFIVGDFRLSLLISARLCKVPFMQITNLTWHPSAQLALEIPDLWFVRFTGEQVVRPLFHLLKPMIFARLARPFNRLAREYGLAGLGTLLDIYCSGDYVFYADHEGLVTTAPLPQNHFIGGAVLGQIDSETTVSASGSTPLVLVSLGSSGLQQLLAPIIAGLADLPVHVKVSTAGHKLELPMANNVTVADYLPLNSLLDEAAVLICNGGSPSLYAALTKGVPTLAIPSNLDQFNVSQAFCKRGVALRLRRENVTVKSISETVQRLLNDATFRTKAREFASELGRDDAKTYFAHLISSLTDGQPVTHQELRARLDVAAKSLDDGNA